MLQKFVRQATISLLKQQNRSTCIFRLANLGEYLVNQINLKLILLNFILKWFLCTALVTINYLSNRLIDTFLIFVVLTQKGKGFENKMH